MESLAAEVRALLIAEIQRDMRGASLAEGGPLGPPCDRFYLTQHKEVNLAAVAASAEATLQRAPPASWMLNRHLESFRLDPTACLRFARIVGIWEIVHDEVRRLGPEEWERVGPGEVREALHENGLFNFWVDLVADRVYVDRRYGPLYGHGVTYRVGRALGPVELEFESMRWRS